MDLGGFGPRIAYWRARRGMTQEQLGALLGMSRRMVQDIEAGLRQADPRISLVEAAAQALTVPIDALLSDAGAPMRECVDQSEVAAIRRALHRPPSQYADRAPRAETVREVEYGWDAFQAAHYSSIGRLLPDLIADATPLGGQPLSLAYQLASATLLKFGDPVTGMIAADRSIAAARDADPVVAGSAERRYADALTNLGDHAGAVEAALAAAGRLEHDLEHSGPAGWSVHAMLLLKGCMGAAARGDGPTVRSLLATADGIAGRLAPDSNEMWSSFNATNVRLYRVAAFVALGDGAAAVSAASRIGQDELAALPRERRAHFLIDLATAHALAGRADSALLVLLAAERLAPQEVHCRTATRELVTDLVRAARPLPEPRLRALAGRCGVSE